MKNYGHQYDFTKQRNTLLVKYQDKKEVSVLTTKYIANMVEKCKTYFGENTVFYYRPLHIENYNSKIGSADIADEFLAPYAFHKKSLTWFKRQGIYFIFHVFVLLNSYIQHRNGSQYKGEFIKFFMGVTHQWLCEHSCGAAELTRQDEATRNTH